MASYDSFIFIGHGNDKNGKYDPGATNGSIHEYNLAKLIVDEVKIQMKEYNVNIHYGNNNYSKELLNGNTYNAKRGLSIHINSASSTATGSEILVPCKQSALELELKLLANLAKQMNIPNRGLKSRKYESPYTWYKRENGKSVNDTDYFKEVRHAYSKGITLSIVEVGFIDKDLKTIQNNIKMIAKHIVGYLIQITNAKQLPQQNGGTFYRVICGSYTNRSNAEVKAQELKNKGYDCFIEVFKN